MLDVFSGAFAVQPVFAAFGPSARYFNVVGLVSRGTVLHGRGTDCCDLTVVRS